MPQPPRQIKKRRLIAGLLGVAVVFLLSGLAAETGAQSTVVISDIHITELSSTYADAAWTTDLMADSKIRWGLVGTGLSNEVSSPDLTTNHSLRMEPLEPDRLYEYQVGSKRESDPEDERVWAPTEPLPFHTPAGGEGSGNPPVLESVFVNANCCQGSFFLEMNRESGYRVDITDGPSGVGAYSQSADGVYQETWTIAYPAQFIPNGENLLPSSEYKYRVKVFDADGNERNYGEFAFRTGNDVNDFVFTAGVCSDGTPLGQCNEQGQFCGPGDLVLNCVACGFECQIGTTCRNGGACTEDPGSGDSAYQCNPPSCYEENGNFIEPAGPGCYSTWQKCNANTVLKVSKDRICNKWMTCRTQTEVENPTTRQKDNLCFDLAACSSIGPDGQCAKPLYGKYCYDDPLQFCETAEDCTYPLCRPASGTWCSQPVEQPVGSGLFEYQSCDRLNGDADCAGIGPEARCEMFRPANVTYTSPDDIQKIRNLSGAINVGLNWTTGQAKTIEGSYPWYFMPQEGSAVTLTNGNFEERETKTEVAGDGTRKTITSYTVKPWSAFGLKGVDGSEAVVSVVPEEQGNLNNPNHVLKIDPTDGSGNYCYGGTNEGDECTGPSDCPGDGLCVEVGSGAQAPSRAFATQQSAAYIISFRIKSSVPEGQQVAVRFFSPNGATTDFARLELTGGWQEITSQPIYESEGGSAWLQFVRLQGAADPFFIDDVQINPMLGLRADGDNVEYIGRSCRLYPKEDSLLCEYKDESGIRYKGWYGYCLERDSKYADRCLSWWPIDVIGGESDIFGTFGSETTAGYQDRSPLYYCLEAKGVDGGDFIDGNVSDYTAHNNAVLGRSNVTGYYDDEEECINILPFSSELFLIGGCAENYFYENRTISLDPSEHYLKSELVQIVIREVTYSNGDWNFGHFVLNEANNWYRHQVVGVNNFVTMTAIFDDAGALSGFLVDAKDGTDNKGGFAAQIEYVLRESCTKVVQVVDEQGNNKAWSARLEQGSAYQLDLSNYRRTDDLAPFGSAVTAEGRPNTWSDPLFIEAPRANESYPFPYQLRAGLPAACNGDCSARYCIGGGGRNGLVCGSAGDCRDVSTGEQGVCSGVGVCTNTVKPCRGNWATRGAAPLPCRDHLGNEIADELCCGSPGGDDFCVGGALSSTGPQAYSESSEWQCKLSGAWCECNDDADCPVNPNGDARCGTFLSGDQCERLGVVEDNLVAKNGLKRLFAEAYGFWTWNTETGRYESQPVDSWTKPSMQCRVCSHDNNIACMRDIDCDGPGSETCEMMGRRGNYNRLYGEADYCANRPLVFGINVNDQRTVDVADGNWVNLKFNTLADPEQLPLGSLNINWSDNNFQTINYPYAPKIDPDSPHVVSHRYFCSSTDYDRLVASGSACDYSDPTQAYPCFDAEAGSCVYQPRVIVSDNWGWCNSLMADHLQGSDCSTGFCGLGEFCEPRYDVCVDESYLQHVCYTDPSNYPPSFVYSSDKFQLDQPIYVRVAKGGS